VSAMTKNGHDNCIVTGSMELAASGEMVIENALSSVDLDKDSTLVTSFISDKYLPGLLIGYVTENTLNPGKLTRSGKVRCSVDFSHIHEVMVIRTMKEKAEE
ncbi:MAG: rod shape-determining protein MreC, partial [Lachnospiraceae bacterium]|nr:rod shape-determining protein MreC [Lachnospiraceae bacterium]